MEEHNFATKQELVRLFNQMKATKSIRRYYKIFKEYTIYICEEKGIIPGILIQFYNDKKLSINEFARLLICYHRFKLSPGEELPDPTFLNENSEGRTKIYDKAIEKIEKRVVFFKKKNEEMPEWDIIYDIDNIHKLLLNALQRR